MRAKLALRTVHYRVEIEQMLRHDSSVGWEYLGGSNQQGSLPKSLHPSLPD